MAEYERVCDFMSSYSALYSMKIYDWTGCVKNSISLSLSN